jgi:5-methylcytosine-specific restriction endonuclease McrA
MRNSERKSNSSRWKKIREQILRRDGYVCYICGGEANTVDHMVPVARGGTDQPDNLAACCASCNYSKKDKLLEDVFLVRDSTYRIPRGFISPPNDSIRHE